MRFDQYNQLWINSHIVSRISDTTKDKAIQTILSLKMNASTLSGIADLKLRMKELIAKNSNLCNYIDRKIIAQIEREQYDTVCRHCPK